MQIPDLIIPFSKQIACVLCVFLTLSFLFVKFLIWITGTSLAGIVGIFAILYGIYKLLRQVGTFALYPGCIRYVKSDYQMRGSQRIIEAIVKNLQQFFGLIFRCQQHADSAYLSTIYFNIHVKQTIQMMSKFQEFLSEKKKQLLLAYRNIDKIITSQYKIQDVTFTYQQFLENPQTVRQRLYEKFKSNNQLKLFAQDFGKKVSVHAKKINQILNTLTPSQATQRDTIKMFIYRVYNQKLYEIRFGYMYWNPRFQYSVHLVESIDSNAVIQCALIQGIKDKPLKDNKCAIICCPNGAYLQYFALQSQYIQMYLEMGYKIVLWNYRGYGQSTGDPTISNCIQDAQAVYNYCKIFLKLTPEIAHGYSIGGPPAACLAYKNAFKILVVDRSFCNFVNIAQQISPFLAKLAKIVMRDDSNINISEIYLKIKNCNKILIWSAVDEIISNGSSLKLGILKKVAGQFDFKQRKSQLYSLSTNSPTAIISQVELSERQGFIAKSNRSKSKVSKINQNQNYLEIWFQKLEEFFQMISSLHQAEKLQQNTTIILKSSSKNFDNSHLIEQVSEQLKNQTKINEQSERRQKIKQTLGKFWQIVGRIDGGGTQISFLYQLATGGLKKSRELHIEIKSFVLGMIFFGSCYHGSDKLNIKTLDNWPTAISSLQKADKQLQNFVKENQANFPKKLMEYIKLFQSILSQMRNSLQKSGSKQKNLGIVVPTDSGHNGELTKNQLQYLKAAMGFQSKIEKNSHMMETKLDFFDE